MNDQNNIIYLEFLDKKHFIKGEWSREPDYCKWEHCGFECVAIRDMTLGIWRGLVGLTKEHPAFNKSLQNILQEDWGFNLKVHGGVSMAGKLPATFKEINRGRWWFGFECSQGSDVIPLVQVDKSDPLYEAAKSSAQSYKNIIFVRKETNKLAKQFFDLKVKLEQVVL